MIALSSPKVEKGRVRRQGIREDERERKRGGE